MRSHNILHIQGLAFSLPLRGCQCSASIGISPLLSFTGHFYSTLKIKASFGLKKEKKRRKLSNFSWLQALLCEIHCLLYNQGNFFLSLFAESWLSEVVREIPECSPRAGPEPGIKSTCSRLTPASPFLHTVSTLYNPSGYFCSVFMILNSLCRPFYIK